MNENIIYTILYFCLCLCFLLFLLFYLHFKVKSKLTRLQTCLSLIFHDWDATLAMWHQINKQQALSQEKDVSSLFEEVLRNICLKDRNARLEEVNNIL